MAELGNQFKVVFGGFLFGIRLEGRERWGGGGAAPPTHMYNCIYPPLQVVSVKNYERRLCRGLLVHLSFKLSRNHMLFITGYVWFIEGTIGYDTLTLKNYY
jgi:hypothetical protein